MLRFWFLGSLFLVLVSAGCGTVMAPAPEVNVDVTVIDEVIEHGNPDGLAVVATTGMVADLVAVIGGDQVHVSQIIGVNVDPRTAALDDTRQALIDEAALIFYNGLGLESAMQDALESAGGIALGDQLQAQDTGAIPAIIVDASGTPDPYIWHDVRVWAQISGLVRDALVEADPDNADAYNANYDTYFEELRLLDEEIEQRVSAIPNEWRLLLSPVDAFDYYERGYGITTETVTADNVEQMARTAASVEVPAVFPVTIGDNAILSDLIQQANTDAYSPRVMQPLYGASLAAPDTYGDTYVDMMRHNTAQIVAGLVGGEVE